MKRQLNKFDVQAISDGVLNTFLVTFTKDSKTLQAHDYMIIEDEDFKGKILDVGCGPGKLAIMAKLLNEDLDITIFDGSVVNLQIAMSLIYNAGLNEYFNKSIKAELGLIGKKLEHRYDTIVLNHILEHLDSLDEAFDWLNEILEPGGTIFIAVPYKDFHYSQNHTRFFKVSSDTNNNGILDPDHKCFDIDTYLDGLGIDAEITIFDESQVDIRQPYNSRGQLDMLIKIKKPGNEVVSSDTILSKH